jgi:hypothetical protein
MLMQKTQRFGIGQNSETPLPLQPHQKQFHKSKKKHQITANKRHLVLISWSC